MVWLAGFFFAISAKEMSTFPSGIMEYDGTRLAVLKMSKKCIWKTQQHWLFSEIMTQLFKIIHRPCCWQFHVETIFLTNPTGEGAGGEGWGGFWPWPMAWLAPVRGTLKTLSIFLIKAILKVIVSWKKKKEKGKHCHSVLTKIVSSWIIVQNAYKYKHFKCTVTASNVLHNELVQISLWVSEKMYYGLLCFEKTGQVTLF